MNLLSRSCKLANKGFKAGAAASLIIIYLLSTGCGMSDMEERRARDLVDGREASFAEQAVCQYGEGTKIENIRAETRTIYNPLFGFPMERETTGSLLGDITAGKETFQGIYLAETGEIYSNKNHENIIESAKVFFDIPGSAILDITLTDAAYRTYYLPDEIKTLKDMLKNRYYMLIHVYTTTNLSHYTKEDFVELYRFYEEYDEETGSVVLIRLKDDAHLAALQKDINSIPFEYENHHGKVYDNKSGGYVDAFEKYQIVETLYLSKKKFTYNR